jgi:hypothetical protein
MEQPLVIRVLTKLNKFYNSFCIFSSYILSVRAGRAHCIRARLLAGWSGVRVPARDGNFSLHHRVQNGSGAHPASYPVDTRGSFSGDKAAGAWSWPLTSICCRVQECMELYLHSSNTPSWRGAHLKHGDNLMSTFYIFSFSIESRLRAGQPGFNAGRGQWREFFSSPPHARPALGLTHPLCSEYREGVKRPDREADHSCPSSAEVKNAWSYTSTPAIRFQGAMLSYAQGQLYLSVCWPSTGWTSLAAVAVCCTTGEVLVSPCTDC